MNKKHKEIKVLFFDHAPVMGGAEHSLLDILVGMNKWPIKAVLLAPRHGVLSTMAKENGIETLDFPFLRGILSIKRDELERKPLRIISSMPEIIRAVVAIKTMLKRGNYQIIYTNSLKSHFLGGLAGKLAGVKVIWHFRDIPVQRLSRFFIFWGAKLLPDKIIAVSKASAAQFGKNARKITVIHNGLEISRILNSAKQQIPEEAQAKLGNAGDCPMIGIVGQISRWKGQDVFIKAADIILKKYPQIKFLVIGGSIFGEDDFGETLNRYVQENQLAEKVIFVGQLSNVYPLIKKLDLLANCSIEPEPFGRVIIEAMSLGIPVIATKGGAAEEIIDNGLDGLIIPPGDPEILAKAMEKVLTGDNFKNEFAAKGPVKVSESFGLEMMLKRISDIIIGESCE